MQEQDKQTLWFPNGCKAGDVVYDIDNNPYSVGRLANHGIGVNIREVTPITAEEAEAYIKAGGNKIISVNPKKGYIAG